MAAVHTAVLAGLAAWAFPARGMSSGVQMGYAWNRPSTACPERVVPEIAEDDGYGCAVTPTSEHIRWQGRTLRIANDMVSFSWEGVQAMMTVRNATNVRVRLMSNFHQPNASFFRVFVDGAPGVKVHVRGSAWQEYTLASGLNQSAHHRILVWYATDPVSTDWNFDVTNQVITIQAFATDGVFGPPPPERTRRLVFIGDSITAGDYIEMGEDADHCKGDHTGTYAARLCEYFQANCSTLALAGHGIFRNCCSDGPTMVQLSKRTNPGDAHHIFRNIDFMPDAIVVHVGNFNDQLLRTEKDKVRFVRSYIAFLIELTERHSNMLMPIFCTIGPRPAPVTGPLVHDAVIRAKQYGLMSVHFVSFVGLDMDGCEDHPGWRGHQQIFDLLKGPLSAVLDWNGTDAYLLERRREDQGRGFMLNTLQPHDIPVWLFAAGIGVPLLCVGFIGGAAQLRKRRAALADVADSSDDETT